MNGQGFLYKLELVDLSYVEAADEMPTKKRHRTLIAAVAACLGVFTLIAAISLPVDNRKPKSLLSGYLLSLDIEADPIAEPIFVSRAEMPQITRSDIIQSMKNNFTVYGTVDSVDTVRIASGDAAWYITVTNMRVDEVLNGETDADMLKIVNGAYLDPDCCEGDEVPIIRLSGCRAGKKCVLVLNETDDSKWDIFGKKVSAKELGDYYIVYALERSGDELTFTEQGITVTTADLR